MKWLRKFFPRLDQYPLSYKMLGYVLLCSSTFALMSTAAQLYIEYRRDVSSLYASMRFIEKSYLAPITDSVYKIDTEHLKLQLKGALNLTDIVHLQVKEQRGDRIIETSVGDLTAENLIRRDFALRYSDPFGATRNIGSLTVTASMDGVYRRLMSRVFTVLATNAAKTFLASAGILAIIYWLITRHLTQISNYTRILYPGKQDIRLSLKRKPSPASKEDELDRVVFSINALQDRVSEDIARRKQHEESLKQAETKYRTVADFTFDWEYWANLDDSLEYVSPSCERISGYTRWDFIDNPSLFTEIIVPDDRDIWHRHYHDCRQEPKPREVQFRIQRRDGQVCWIEHSCQPVTDPQGFLQGFRASNRDITSRKLAEVDLRTAYAKIEQLKNQLEAETAYLQAEIKLEHNFENIVGNSAALKYVLYKVEQVAAADTTVLVLGETGTGKELVARAIHNNSPRKCRPLVKVNCATLPSHLIESELFGHEPGAFTGARTRQLGRFEVADGTSIFLDEIGELPLELQTRLLRVLQDGEFERLGSSRTIKVNVRVIAATNRDLEEEVRKGRFREDLFYRLNVFPITVPPLRDRGEDISLLTRYFVEKASKRLGRSIEQIPESIVAKLKSYDWPGNIRELENVIERAVINSPGSRLCLADDLAGPARKQMSSPLKSLQETEKEHILRVLQATNWRIDGAKGAALILDMNPSTLRSRMRKIGIQKT